MTHRSFIYDITFIDGLTMPIVAANKKLAIVRAVIARADAVRTEIVSIERRLPKGQTPPRALYSVRLCWGPFHSGIKLLACDAAAAIAAARHVFAAEYSSVPHMSTRVLCARRLGTGYDEDIITFTA